MAVYERAFGSAREGVRFDESKRLINQNVTIYANHQYTCGFFAKVAPGSTVNAGANDAADAANGAARSVNRLTERAS